MVLEKRLVDDDGDGYDFSQMQPIEGVDGVGVVK